jgi:hypothetical protein
MLNSTEKTIACSQCGHSGIETEHAVICTVCGISVCLCCQVHMKWFVSSKNEDVCGGCWDEERDDREEDYIPPVALTPEEIMALELIGECGISEEDAIEEAKNILENTAWN